MIYSFTELNVCALPIEREDYDIPCTYPHIVMIFHEYFMAFAWGTCEHAHIIHHRILKCYDIVRLFHDISQHVMTSAWEAFPDVLHHAIGGLKTDRQA